MFWDFCQQPWFPNLVWRWGEVVVNIQPVDQINENYEHNSSNNHQYKTCKENFILIFIWLESSIYQNAFLRRRFVEERFIFWVLKLTFEGLIKLRTDETALAEPSQSAGHTLNQLVNTRPVTQIRWSSVISDI